MAILREAPARLLRYRSHDVLLGSVRSTSSSASLASWRLTLTVDRGFLISWASSPVNRVSSGSDSSGWGGAFFLRKPPLESRARRPAPIPEMVRGSPPQNPLPLG